VRPPQSSQVSLRTAFTVCFAVTATAGLVLFVLETRVALTLTVCAAMLAMALDHLVRRLERRGMKRGGGIALVMGAALLLGAGIVVLVIPPTVAQVRALSHQAPQLLDNVRNSDAFNFVDRHLGVGETVRRLITGSGPDSGSTVLGAIGGLLTGLAGALTLAVLVVFMLIFGPALVKGFFEQVDAEVRPHWEHLAASSYASVGHYLSGLMVICSVNAILTTTCLAILQLPFFLPLGLLSGFSSLVPYAGPFVVGVLVVLTAMVTSGWGKALLVLGYFILYGQFEGNILAPLVFRKTMHVDPLVTLLAVLFLAELLGVVGAVVAVPAVAVAQIILSDLLEHRRQGREARGGET
jgi:putative heme transporter